MKLMRMSSEGKGTRRKALAFAIAAALSSGTAGAGEKLDMSFIQGGTGVNPVVWAALNDSYGSCGTGSHAGRSGHRGSRISERCHVPPKTHTCDGQL